MGERLAPPNLALIRAGVLATACVTKAYREAASVVAWLARAADMLGMHRQGRTPVTPHLVLRSIWRSARSAAALASHATKCRFADGFSGVESESDGFQNC